MTRLTTPLAGVDVTRASDTAEFSVGTRVQTSDGKEHIYVQTDAGGATGAGYVVLLDEDLAGDMIDTTNSASAFGQKVGIANGVVGASQYAWVQIFGTASIRVNASAAANATLNTTTTAGQLDDDATSGAEQISGLVLTTAGAGAAGNAEGVLNYPTVGATIGA